MKTSDPLSVTIVGAGLMGRWHAAAAASCGGRVDAVIDEDFRRAAALSEVYRGSRASSRLADVLAEGHARVVHVCTPTATHESIARQSIEAGCHVLVEKPLAPTVEATRSLVNLASARGVRLCPVHQFLFQPGVRRVVSRLPRLGTICHIDLVVCSAGAAGEPDAVLDQVAFDVLPHPLSLLVRILGSRFDELAWHAAHVGSGELRAWGFARGVSTATVVSMSGRPPVNRLHVLAARGSAHCDLFHGFSTIESGAVSRTRKILRPMSTSAMQLGAAVANLGRRAIHREFAYPGLRALVRDFYHAIAQGGPGPIQPREMLAVAAARDAIVACWCGSLGPAR